MGPARADRPSAGREDRSASPPEAVHDPLTPGRLLRNVVESPALTRLRIPADPHEAETRFCG